VAVGALPMGASISTASQIIGFISFTITLLTLLKVSWGSIMTIMSAPKEARDYLDNLRQEIFELREEVKKANRRQRPRGNSDPKSSGTSLETSSIRVLNVTIKHLQHEFKRLERPFMVTAPNEDGDMDSPWTHYHSKVNYQNMDLSHRIYWLRSKGEIVDMAQRVNRILTRKIAYEMNTALA
jgi:hypothetical protein